jgi:hypothetical protein
MEERGKHHSRRQHTSRGNLLLLFLDQHQRRSGGTRNLTLSARSWHRGARGSRDPSTRRGIGIVRTRQQRSTRRCNHSAALRLLPSRTRAPLVRAWFCRKRSTVEALGVRQGHALTNVSNQ